MNVDIRAEMSARTGHCSLVHAGRGLSEDKDVSLRQTRRKTEWKTTPGD